MATQKSNLGLILCLTITTVAMGFYARWASNIWPEALRVILLGFVLTAWTTWLILAKLRGCKKKGMLLPMVVEQRKCGFEEEHTADADAGLLGDGMIQEESTLVFGTGTDETKEEPAPELDPVPFKDTSSQRKKTEPIGCFNLQGFFTKSRKK